MSRLLRLSIFAVAACTSGAGSHPLDVVHLGDAPEAIAECSPMGGLPYFEAQIWPQYLNPSDPTRSCARSGCHDKPDAAGGIGLDATAPVDYASNDAIVQPWLDCEAPSSSLLLTKPLGVVAHAGGQLFTTSDPEYSIFLAWFQ